MFIFHYENYFKMNKVFYSVKKIIFTKKIYWLVDVWENAIFIESKNFPICFLVNFLKLSVYTLYKVISNPKKKSPFSINNQKLLFEIK